MPTTAKLCAAVLFALLAALVSEMLKPTLPDGTRTAWLTPVNAGFGLLLGWRIMGARAGDSWRAAMGYGLTTVVAILFWCLLIWAAYEMTLRSLGRRYHGPVEALQEMVELMIRYAEWMLGPELIAAMVLGGILGGLVTEAVGRRYE